MERKVMGASRVVAPGTATPSGVPAPPLSASLPPPVVARPRLRRSFDPVAGRFRALEREVNLFLSRHVFPRIPGFEMPYRRILERRLTVSEAEVEIPGLGREHPGIRILFVTDIHSGPFVTPGMLRRAFSRLMALEPDLVLLGGDLTTSRVDELDRCEPALSLLGAPLGTFGVLGNHDHYTLRPGEVRRSAGSCGIRILHNESVVMASGGGRLALAGIDDLNMGRPDLDAALDGIPAGVPVVLLSHNPDILFRASEMGVSLVLSGHTHGGQVRIPGLPVLVRQSRYRLDWGRYRSGGTELVVSRGLGATGLPIRIACPPEAVLVTLRPSP